MARLSKKNEELLKAVQRQAARQQGRGIDSLNRGGQADSTKGAAAEQDNQSNNPAERDTANGSKVESNDPAVSPDAYAQHATQLSSADNPDRNASAVGLGVDLVEIDRMETVIKRTPRILERVFTSEEREYAWSKTRPAVHYAAFFAAREAVLKALGIGFVGVNFSDVEVTHDNKGKPEVVLHGNASRIAEQQGVVEIQISLSHTHQMAVASAVAIKAQSSPRKVEVIDPMEELARQFKELRMMLDDIGSSDIMTEGEQDEQDGQVKQAGQVEQEEQVEQDGQVEQAEQAEQEEQEEPQQESE